MNEHELIYLQIHSLIADKNMVATQAINSGADLLYDAALRFLAHSCRNGWPEEYPDLDDAFTALIQDAVNRCKMPLYNPFNQICDAAANWQAERLVTEMFKDK
jgi:hypothetical protein